MLDTWWIWMTFAILVGILEIFISGYIFLGFAFGAAVTGILLLVGGPIAAWLSGSVATTLLVFAFLSLIGWVLMRKLVGVRDGQIKVFDRDINED